MKNLKRLALLSIATAAVLAFSGGGSASATVLCQAKFEVCPKESIYKVGTLLHGELVAKTEWRLLSGAFEAKCTESNLFAENETTGGAGVTVFGPITEFKQGGCSCAVTVVKPGRFVVHWIAASLNGNWTEEGVEITVNCGGNICTFAGEINVNATLNGGNPAKLVTTNATIPKTAGIACKNPGLLTAEYNMTSPQPLYVSER